jgi:2-keto-4-pentenoate hydratase/2-oxohepta-3-ene-1,7-dioic acid hydratase in catechol pathway
MKLAAFRWRGEQHLGCMSGDGSCVRRFDLPPGASGAGVLRLIGAEDTALDQTLSLEEVQLLAPVPRPHRNVFCVGKNYHDHASEFAASGFDSSASAGTVPRAPIIFSKVPESVIGPGAPIEIDAAVSVSVDYEVELAVIIGRAGRNIPAQQALQHVWGYTIINDVTARDLQGLHSQWLISKSQDTFCPMGPAVVTAADLDLADTPVRCWVNDELRQEANTAALIFDVPTIIAALSNGITLLPGDVIATGTPAGVGLGFDPPRYLQPGDRVRLEIPPIGVLENPVVAAPQSR